MITTPSTLVWTSVHSFSGTQPDLIPWLYLSLPLCNHNGFDLGHTWKVNIYLERKLRNIEVKYYNVFQKFVSGQRKPLKRQMVTHSIKQFTICCLDIHIFIKQVNWIYSDLWKYISISRNENTAKNMQIKIMHIIFMKYLLFPL